MPTWLRGSPWCRYLPMLVLILWLYLHHPCMLLFLVLYDCLIEVVTWLKKTSSGKTHLGHGMIVMANFLFLFSSFLFSIFWHFIDMTINQWIRKTISRYIDNKNNPFLQPYTWSCTQVLKCVFVVQLVETLPEVTHSHGRLLVLLLLAQHPDRQTDTHTHSTNPPLLLYGN